MSRRHDPARSFLILIPRGELRGRERRAAPLYACNPLQRHYWPITRDATVIRFQIVYE